MSTLTATRIQPAIASKGLLPRLARKLLDMDSAYRSRMHLTTLSDEHLRDIGLKFDRNGLHRA